jgi:bifunctional non-homologous end joining protein LigD
VVLDGELIVADERGRPSFERIQQRLRATNPPLVRRLRNELPVTYMIFDVLWHADRPALTLPYVERRALLEQLHLTGPTWQTIDCVTGADAGMALLQASRAHGLEGIVAKRTTSRYRPGRRSRTWLKVKNLTRERFWVGGWLPGAAGVGALRPAARPARRQRAPTVRRAGRGRLRPGRPARPGPPAEAVAVHDQSLPTRPEPGPAAQPIPPTGRCLPAGVRPPPAAGRGQYLTRTSDGRLRHAAYKGLKDPWS